MNWLRNRLSLKTSRRDRRKGNVSMPIMHPEDDESGILLSNAETELQVEISSLRKALAASIMLRVVTAATSRAGVAAICHWRRATAPPRNRSRTNSLASFNSGSLAPARYKTTSRAGHARRQSIQSLKRSFDFQKRGSVLSLRRRRRAGSAATVRSPRTQTIATPYGLAVIRRRRSDHIIEAKLSFATAYVHSSKVHRSALKGSWTMSNISSIPPLSRHVPVSSASPKPSNPAAASVKFQTESHGIVTPKRDKSVGIGVRKRSGATSDGAVAMVISEQKSVRFVHGSAAHGSAAHGSAAHGSAAQDSAKRIQFDSTTGVVRQKPISESKSINLTPTKPVVPSDRDDMKNTKAPGRIPRRFIDYLMIYRIEQKSVGTRPVLYSRGRTPSQKDIDRAMAQIGDLASHLSARYPPTDHSDFPMDENWGAAFAFLKGLHLSAHRRNPHVYHSVLTQSRGDRLFASYLRLDEPIPIDVTFDHFEYLPAARTPAHSPARIPRRQGQHIHIRKARDKIPVRSASQPATPTTSRSALHADEIGEKMRAASDFTAPFLLYNPLNGETAQASNDPISQLYTEDEPSDVRPIGPKTVSAHVPMSICIVSHYPLFKSFRLILEGLLAVHNSPTPSDPEALERWIAHIVTRIPLPIPGHTAVSFDIPGGHRDIAVLPSVRTPFLSNLSLSDLLRHLPVKGIATVLSALLTERRLLFHSQSMARVTETTQMCLQLMHPFQWWYTLIPTLAECMLDAVEMPLPYILGVHSTSIGKIPRAALSETVIVDLDAQEVILPSTSTMALLPARLIAPFMSTLREAAGALARDSDLAHVETKGEHGTHLMTSIDINIYRSLYKMYGDLVSGYRKFLYFVDSVPFFNAEGFVEQRCRGLHRASDRDFYEAFAFSRAFEVFLEDEAVPDEYHEILSLHTDAKQLLIREGRTQVNIHIPPPHKPTSHSSVTQRIESSAPVGAGTFTAPAHWCAAVWQRGRPGPVVTADPVAWRRYETQARHLARTTYAKLTTPGHSERSGPALTQKGDGRHVSDSAVDPAVHIVHTCIVNLLSGREIKSAGMKAARRALESEPARAAFARMLGGGGRDRTGPNSIQCLTSLGFQALSTIASWFLDICARKKDYRKGVAVMTLSTVFYAQHKESNRREFLGDMLQKHHFWKNLNYWRAALRAAVLGQSFRSRNDKSYYGFVQGWLVENLHKMVVFRVSMRDIRDFVQEVTERHNLPYARRKEIAKFVDRMRSMYQALQQLG